MVEVERVELKVGLFGCITSLGYFMLSPFSFDSRS